jgi:hypothetical protein
MGLDFNRSEVHWGYSGFAAFREKLALEIGIELEKMNGFGGNRKWDNIIDPIALFLDHSDCEGELSPNECAKIYPRLLDLVRKWDDKDVDKAKAIQLANDMEECHLEGEPLVFC